MSKVDFFSGICIMIFSGIVYMLAEDMPKAELGIGPGDHPQFIVIILFILGLALAVQSYFKKVSQENKKLYTKDNLIKVIAMLVLTFAYIQIMPYIGFLYLTPIYLLAAMLLFGMRNWLVSISVSIVFSVAMYWIFTTVFYVMLPEFTLF